MHRRILAVETATPRQSIAVLEGTTPIATLEQTAASGQTRWLIPAIDRLLASIKMRLSDLDGLVLSAGPGSFTGLRTSFATMMGLRYVTGLPLVGVPTLEGMAWTLRGETRTLCPIIHAQTDHVYWACFRWEGERLLRLTEDQLGTWSDLRHALREPVLLFGEGWQRHRQTVLDQFVNADRFHQEGPADCMSPSAVSVGRAGLERLEAGERLASGEGPRYVQRARAEVEELKHRSESMGGRSGRCV